MARLQALEKFYKTRFRSSLYYTAVFNLNCLHIFSSSLSLLTFRRAKSYKSARHRQNIAFGESWLRSLIKVQVNLTFNSLAQEFITAFCSGVAVRHPSVGCYLPSNPFILFLGGAELLQLATRFGERLTNSQTVLPLVPKTEWDLSVILMVTVSL